MDGTVVGRNEDTLERLRALGNGMSEHDLLRAIDPPWTASALFAHMAFWDRFTEARWVGARETGRASPIPIEDDPLERINLAGLRQWLLLPPRAAVDECVAAAEAVNRVIASLDAAIVEDLLRSDRVRLVDRSLHRNDHLGTIEAAFGGDAPPG